MHYSHSLSHGITIPFQQLGTAPPINCSFKGQLSRVQFLIYQIYHNSILVPSPLPRIDQQYFGPQPTSRDQVCVPRIGFMTCTSLRQQLDIIIDPLAHSDNFGCNIYLQVVGIVGQHLSHGCTNCPSFSCHNQL